MCTIVWLSLWLLFSSWPCTGAHVRYLLPPPPPPQSYHHRYYSPTRLSRYFSPLQRYTRPVSVQPHHPHQRFATTEQMWSSHPSAAYQQHHTNRIQSPLPPPQLPPPPPPPPPSSPMAFASSKYRYNIALPPNHHHHHHPQQHYAATYHSQMSSLHLRRMAALYAAKVAAAAAAAASNPHNGGAVANQFVPYADSPLHMASSNGHSSAAVPVGNSASSTAVTRYIPVVKKVTHHHIHHIVPSPSLMPSLTGDNHRSSAMMDSSSSSSIIAAEHDWNAAKLGQLLIKSLYNMQNVSPTDHHHHRTSTNSIAAALMPSTKLRHKQYESEYYDHPTHQSTHQFNNLIASASSPNSMAIKVANTDNDRGDGHRETTDTGGEVHDRTPNSWESNLLFNTHDRDSISKNGVISSNNNDSNSKNFALNLNRDILFEDDVESNSNMIHNHHLKQSSNVENSPETPIYSHSHSSRGMVPQQPNQQQSEQKYFPIMIGVLEDPSQLPTRISNSLTSNLHVTSSGLKSHSSVPSHYDLEPNSNGPPQEGGTTNQNDNNEPSGILYYRHQEKPDYAERRNDGQQIVIKDKSATNYTKTLHHQQSKQQVATKQLYYSGPLLLADDKTKMNNMDESNQIIRKLEK